MLILFFKPYIIGDFIMAQGEKGTVEEINIFTTRLVTPERKEAIIPNGKIVDGNIINMTREGKIRVDISVGISYGADIDEAREVLLHVPRDHPLVLDDPVPSVLVNALGDSSVNLIVRSFCLPSDYRDVYFQVTEQCKKALDAAKITIPFPQRVIHTVKE
ncbi:MAG: mechanosensitive ion channel [bacterium]|nr:mechanosensitive ion channel [bacterium]